MLRLRIINDPGEIWDSFSSRFSNIFFHRSEWGRVLAEGLGFEVRYYCLYDEKKIVMGMPAIVYDLKFLRMLYSNIPYGGPIGEKRYLNTFYDLLKDELEKDKIHRVRVVNFPGFSLDLEDGEYPANYYPSGESLHHLLTLKELTHNQIWEGYRHSARRAVNKAKREGVTIERIKGRDGIPEAYRCYLEAMQRNKAPASIPIKLLYAIYDNLIPNHADMFMAILNNKCIAFVCIVYSKDYAHYFVAGSLTDYLQHRPNDLLVHTAIFEAKQIGKYFFDFIGTTSRGDLNLARFKEKWGAKRGELPIYIWEISRFRCTLWNILSKGLKTGPGSWVTGCMRLMDARKA